MILTAAVVLVSTAVILLKISTGRPMHKAVFAVAAAAGLCIISPIGRCEPAWSGLPYSSVSAVAGRAVSDSRRLSNGRYLLEFRLERVRAPNGASADAGGRVILFFSADPSVRRGRKLVIETGLKADEQTADLILRQRPGSYSLLRNTPVFTASPDTDSISRGGWSSGAAEYRAELLDGIAGRCSRMGPEAGGLFAALFYGCRDGLSTNESGIFRRAGCAHILALSGMHLGILSAVILFLLKPVPYKKAVFAVSCAVIIFYLYLTGFGTSLVRAALMYFAAGASYAFYRKCRAGDVLLLSFIILVAIEPESFYTAAFRLSFLAVAGIIVMTPHIGRLLRPWMPAAISLALSASIGAQLFVSPLLADLFGELYPAGIAAGIIEAPMVTVFIWIGIIYLITGWGAAAKVCTLLYRLIFFTAEKAAGLPALNTTGRTAAVAVVCTALCLIVILYSRYRRNINGLPGKL